jgi:hypothetical protein
VNFNAQTYKTASYVSVNDKYLPKYVAWEWAAPVVEKMS